MKALLLSRYRNLEMTEIPVPKPGPDEVLDSCRSLRNLRERCTWL